MKLAFSTASIYLNYSKSFRNDDFSSFIKNYTKDWQDRS